jgi:aspartyl-tRNA(Asn)/glutamyl-tRNA(Gln) amidotransferase subunit A
MNCSHTSDASHTSLSDLRAQIAGGQLSSEALVLSLLARIEALDARCGAWRDLYADEALAAARAADAWQAQGGALGPLHGLPVALKEIFEIEGRVMAAGSRVWQQRRCSRTATVVQRLREAGALILGSTRAVEFSMGGWGSNAHFGTPLNPWDPLEPRTPGGSSSGAAVALAAGMVPAALGSDTGGSVRTPAAWCNLTAFKPSSARIPRDGVLPLSDTLDTVGLMARSVLDVQLLYEVLREPDAPASGWHAVHEGDTDTPLAGVRLGCLVPADRAGVDAQVLAAYDAALATMLGLGAQLRPVELPCGFAEAGRLNGLIIAAEGYSHLHRWLDDPLAPLDEHVRARLLPGRSIPAKDYLQALRARHAWDAQWASLFDTVDLVLTPSTLTPPLPLQAVDQTQAPSHFLRIANFFDLPSLALPNGHTRSGLPTSMQFMGPPAGEGRVLALGRCYQAHTAWHLRRPPDSALTVAEA